MADLQTNQISMLTYGVTNTGSTGLPFLLTATNSKKLTEFFVESGENIRTNPGTVLKDTSNVTITDILDEANDKFVLPSNLFTARKTYNDYSIRITISGDVDGPAGTDVEYEVRLRRQVDDSIISENRIVKVSSLVLDNASTVFETFVDGESDPFVVDGFYIDILAPSGAADLNITAASYLIKAKW